MYFLNADFDKYALPEPLTSRYKNADGAALKVALFALQERQVSPETVMSELGLSEPVAGRALAFWVSAGLLGEGDSPKIRARLTTADLARISMVNPEIPIIMREAQNYLGRQISYAENVCIADLYVNDGIPSDLLLFIIAYSAERAGSSRFTSYLSRVASEWKKAGIDTLGKAEAHVAAQQLQTKQCELVSKVLGVESSTFKLKDRRYINVWFSEYGYDEQFAAEASLQCGKTDISYLNAIIKSWFGKGYKTVKETRADSLNAPVPTKNAKKRDGLFENTLKKYEDNADDE